MERTLFEGCDGDVASVSWRKEPNHAAGLYTAKKTPIRVILRSPGIIPHKGYLIEIHWEKEGFYQSDGENIPAWIPEEARQYVLAPCYFTIEPFYDYDSPIGVLHYKIREGVGYVEEPPESGNYVYKYDYFDTRRILFDTLHIPAGVRYKDGSQYPFDRGRVRNISAKAYDYESGELVGELPNAPTNAEANTDLNYYLIVQSQDEQSNWEEKFKLKFNAKPQDVDVDCDCDYECVKTYRPNQQEYYCICKELEDDDLKVDIERIKAEVKADLVPLLKTQIKAELKPEIKAELEKDELLRNSIRDAIKEVLKADEEFKTDIKQLLLDDATFIEKVTEAVTKKQEADEGYTYETVFAGQYEMIIRLKNGTPNRLSIPMQQLPWEEDPIIPQTLAEKYGRVITIGAYQPTNGRLVAPLS